MINYSDFFAYLHSTALKDVAGVFAERTRVALCELSHGDYEGWCEAIEGIPGAVPSAIDFNADAVRVAGDMEESVSQQLKERLMQLHPWRKGPSRAICYAYASIRSADTSGRKIWARCEICFLGFRGSPPTRIGTSGDG